MRSIAMWPVAGLLLTAAAWPQLAQAGMGNRGVVPTYHPEPCRGETCRADDTRSGLPCQGLICSFSSAKSMQPPLTAAQAAESQKAAAVAETPKTVAAVPANKSDVATKKKRAGRAKKTKLSKAGDDAAAVQAGTAPR